mgnify:CR=1 FL=1
MTPPTRPDDSVTPHVASVNVGAARTLADRPRATGIDKRPVTGPIAVGVPGPAASGMTGDAIGDTAHHGGPDQAVYAVAGEDLDHFATVVGRPLAAGTFGENLTTRGLDVSGAEIGARWAIGSTVLEVSAPRIPCSTFTAWMGRDDWRSIYVAAGRPGAYLRVIEPGAISAGDAIEVRSTPGHGITVADAYRAETDDADRLVDLVDLDAYPVAARERARVRLERRPDRS